MKRKTRRIRRMIWLEVLYRRSIAAPISERKTTLVQMESDDSLSIDSALCGFNQSYGGVIDGWNVRTITSAV